MKSLMAIRYVSASALLFVSSAVLAECVQFSSPITMDNTIPSLAGKQCSCLCTINPISQLFMIVIRKKTTVTTVASCSSSSSPKLTSDQIAPDTNCIEQAAPSSTPPSTASSKKICYKLNPAITNPTTKKRCAYFYSAQALSGTEAIQLQNPTILSDCSAFASFGLVCEKTDLPRLEAPTTAPKKAPVIGK